MVIWWDLVGLPFGFFDWRTTVHDEIVFFIFDVVVWFLSLFHFLLILFVSVAGCQLLRPYEITSSVSTLATSLRLTDCLISSHPFLIWFFFSTVFVKVNRTIEPSSCQIHGVFFFLLLGMSWAYYFSENVICGAAAIGLVAQIRIFFFFF